MEEYVTFKRVIDKLESFANRHPNINSFGFGNLVEYGKNVENTAPLYPLLFVVPQAITYDNNITTYTLQLFFGDRLNNDNEGSVSVVSQMSLIAKDLLGLFKRNEEFMEFADFDFPITAQPFMERFNDVLAGVSMTLPLSVSDYLDVCQLNDIIASPTPTPTTTPIDVTPTPTPSITPTSTSSPTPTPSITPSSSPLPVTPTPTASSTPVFDGFIIEVDTRITQGTVTNLIELPITISNGTIDWGDGNIDTGVNATIALTTNHTYSTGGIYEIKISKDITRIAFNNIPEVKNKIIDVKQWGDSIWSSFEFAFYGCSNLNVTATDAPNLSNVTNMSGMFLETPFNSPIGNWDVSNVQNMTAMFSQSQFNQDISGWDVSNVTNISFMFSLTPFNHNIGNWNVSNVTNMFEVFAGSSFNQDISGWDTSNVTTMNSMFANTPFNQDISGWNTSNVSSTGFMFFGATNFNQDLSSWDFGFNFDMPFMFFNATSFNQDLGSWNLRLLGLDMSNMLDNSGMSVENYSRTLIGWSNYVNNNSNQPSNITFGASGIQYNNTNYGGTPFNNAVDGRDYLTTTAGWSINDAGQV